MHLKSETNQTPREKDRSLFHSKQNEKQFFIFEIIDDKMENHAVP